MKKQQQNRWLVVFGATLIQLCLVAFYAWSVYTPTLREAGWNKLETQLVFAIGLLVFAVSMVFAGRRLKSWGPQKLARTGGVVLGAGYLLTGLLGPTNFWVVCLGVGGIGGIGIGLGYVVPIAVGMNWFPDRKGLITGLAVAGFGFGAMAWVKLAGNWGNLLETLGLGGTFMLYGVLFAGLILLGSTWMKMPPKGWRPEGYELPEHSAGSGVDNFKTREMLHTPQFYLIFLIFSISAGAGLMAVGLMKLYPMEALQESGYSLAESSAIAGTAMAVFFSLSNGLGRILWGVLSDRLGRKYSVILMTGSQGLVFLLFTQMAGSEGLLYLGATLIGFNFGGNFALFPALTADEFGNENVGRNYPYVFLSYGLGGVVFPIVGGLLGDLNNFGLAFLICGASCLVAAGASAIIFPPHRDEANQPFSMHGFFHQLHLFDHERDLAA
ncbi:MAG: L-lactate MFS transporter [bacterium]